LFIKCSPKNAIGFCGTTAKAWHHPRPKGEGYDISTLASGDSMQVSEVLVSKGETAGPETPIRELAHRMRELAIGFIPIVEGDRLVGVITDRDIALRGNPETAPARDSMSMEVICCFQDESVEQARQLMAEHNVSRLPVIDRTIIWSASSDLPTSKAK
jgi:CBS domain-containing protein